MCSIKGEVSYLVHDSGCWPSQKIAKGSQSPGAPALGICIKVALLVAAWTAAAAGREQLLKRFLKWLKLHSTWQQEAHS